MLIPTRHGEPFEESFDPIEQDALTRALEMERAKGGVAQPRIERMLETESWWDAATFAAYSCQIDSLHVQPWQPVPCQIGDADAVIAAGNDGTMGHYAAAKLLQRLLRAGLSEYEPDPIAALERANVLPHG
jgi:hypothetical protein